MTLSTCPDALWLNASLSFERFDYKLLGCLARHVEVAQWAYRQTPDEPSCLDIAVTLLHDYLKGHNRPVHLMGHGTGGLVGLLYARQNPHRVKSLTLLSVGVNPMIDWQAHYYAQLERLPCPRSHLLTQMAYSLFGHQARPLVSGWVKLLEQDLLHSISPHSLLKRASLCPGSVAVPLLVCGGEEDAIIDLNQIRGWQPWLKTGDRIALFPGRHFFHGVSPQPVAKRVLSFWEMTDHRLVAPQSLRAVL
ncbi:alpha/beta hydrolase [Nodosilinea sp. LEGE 07088]|uniref:alpha/beta fold hydrolase n=1 Tax=Nodosilinea sp. LEGE 07088 TaxID=2777968 RepID=UPI0018807888|nr:alpha/beta hydrolase [Nodosilinea sp. LEGE 07088]MBE9138427.1 alpha/beta hydrolase [Nodosilinea sp. LEGE 07088]